MCSESARFRFLNDVRETVGFSSFFGKGVLGFFSVARLGSWFVHGWIWRVQA
jgi:hypothetical protein